MRLVEPRAQATICRLGRDSAYRGRKRAKRLFCCAPRYAGFHLDPLARRGRRRCRWPLPLQSFQMELYRFANQGKHLVLRFGGGHAPRKVGHMRSVRRRPAPRRRDIACASPLLLDSGLLQHAVRCPGWHVDARFACHGYRALLRQVRKLAMTSFHANRVPSVGFKERDEFSCLRGRDVPTVERLAGQGVAASIRERGSLARSQSHFAPRILRRVPAIGEVPERRPRVRQAGRAKLRRRWRTGLTVRRLGGASKV